MWLLSFTTQLYQKWSQHVRRISDFLHLISVPFLIHTWAHAGKVLKHSRTRLHVCFVYTYRTFKLYCLFRLLPSPYGMHHCVISTPHGDLNPLYVCNPRQANETFAFVGNVTHYARVWLNISAQLRTFLEDGRMHDHLAWLQQVNNRPSSDPKVFIEHIQNQPAVTKVLDKFMR